MSVPKYCLDIGRSHLLKCSCSVPPPAFNVVLPLIPTTTDHTVDGPKHEITTDGPFTGNTDTSFSTPLDSKLLGIIVGIIILFVILIVIGCCLRRRRGPEDVQGAERSRLKLSPSSCSQKPLLPNSNEASGNPILDEPQQPNGESEKMMEIIENSPKADKINEISFDGGGIFIPMIDEEDVFVNEEIVSSGGGQVSYPKIDNPQLPNGEFERIIENLQKADKINDASLNGEDFVPMNDEEDVNDDVVSKVVFNESSC